MITTKFSDARVVVRKVALGAAPYGWEIYDGHTSTPRYVCPDRFRSMETAYKAGQAWLANLVPTTQRPDPRRTSVTRRRPAVKVRLVEADWSMDTDEDVLMHDEADLPE